MLIFRPQIYLHAFFCYLNYIEGDVHFQYDLTGGNLENLISSDPSSVIKVSTNGNLVISKVDASMKGSYTCEADNGFGKPLSKTIEVLVRGKLFLI